MKIETYYTAAKGSIGSFCHLLSSFLNRVSGNPFAGTFRLFSFFHSADCATANIPGVRFRARIRPSAD